MAESTRTDADGTTGLLRVAAAQIRSGTDPAENLPTVLDAISDAAREGAEVVVLPEASMSSFAVRPSRAAQTLQGPFASEVRRRAREHRIVAVVGIFEPARDGRTFNTLLVTGRDSAGAEVEAAYRKIHLFDAFGSRESDTIAPGDEVVTVEIAGTRVGLATCYDLRFAEHFTQLGRAGAQVVLVPSSWGDGPGKAEQWDVLARARAMDAQAWLVACDQAWQPPQKAAPLGLGRSLVAGPLGQLRQQLGAEPGLLVADLPLQEVAQARQQVPVLAGS